MGSPGVDGPCTCSTATSHAARHVVQYFLKHMLSHASVVPCSDTAVLDGPENIAIVIPGQLAGLIGNSSKVGDWLDWRSLLH